MIYTTHHFDTEAAAKADLVIGAYWIADQQGGGNWRGDVCIPNAQVSQVNGSTTDAQGNVIPTYAYQSGWFIRIGDASNAALVGIAYAVPTSLSLTIPMQNAASIGCCTSRGS